MATAGPCLGKLPLPLGQSQEVPFYGENFYTEIHLNSEERVRARARLTALEELKLLEFPPPRRFSGPIGNQLARLGAGVLRCSHLPSLWLGPKKNTKLLRMGLFTCSQDSLVVDLITVKP